MSVTCLALASVASIEEPSGVLKLIEVSEKSALGTNSVPSKGTRAMLAMKIMNASARVSSLWASDQRSMPW
ncbi:hypothetical protein D3C77_710060 [compost metagenome]